MYDWEPRVLLRHYLEQGLSKTAIAERIGISRRCIYNWIAHGDLDRTLEPGSVCYPPRPTQLDPYQDLIRKRLDTCTFNAMPRRPNEHTSTARQLAPRPEPAWRPSDSLGGTTVTPLSDREGATWSQ